MTETAAGRFKRLRLTWAPGYRPSPAFRSQGLRPIEGAARVLRSKQDRKTSRWRAFLTTRKSLTHRPVPMFVARISVAPPAQGPCSRWRLRQRQTPKPAIVRPGPFDLGPEARDEFIGEDQLNAARVSVRIS
jgi:hypothetical protein